MQKFKKLLCFSVTAACLASQTAPAIPVIAAESITQEIKTEDSDDSIEAINQIETTETMSNTADIGTDIVEVLAASSELAGSEKSDTEALKEKINSIQENYENLPEEDQAAMSESMEALSNAEAAVDKELEDQEAIENGEPIVIEENDKPNSWRYVNGERIDDAIDVVQDEVYDASGEDITEGTEIISINDGEVLLGVERDRYEASYNFGIDVSYHNGSINWSTIKNSGEVKYAIIRCGYGTNKTSQDDTKWSYNSSQCEKYGIPYGTYLYSYATSTTNVDSEAEHVLRLVKGKDMQLPIFYDMEENSQYNLGRSTVVSFATRFCNKMKSSGYKVGIYANKNWFDNRLGTYLNNNTDIYAWIARYNSTLGYSGRYDIWQYSSTGSVSGVSGNVDVNRWYTTMPSSGSVSPTYYITCNYYSGYARKDSESGQTFTSDNVYIGTESYPYGSTAFAEYGLDNATNGAFNLSAPGYAATGYWILGSLSGTTKIHQDSTFATSEALAEACGKDLSAGNVTLNFYAEFKPNVLTLKYYSGIATQDTNNNKTFTSNNVLLDTRTYNYNANTFNTYGLPNFSGGTWMLTKPGYKRTGYWHVGSQTSATKIHEDTAFATTQALATAAGKDLSAGNVSLNLYPGMTANTLKINYYSGEADEDTKSGTEYLGENKFIQSATYSYDGTNLSQNGLPDAVGGGTWNFAKDDYVATGNWLVGSTASDVKINQYTKFATIQELATAAGKDLSSGDVEINLYPEFKQLDLEAVSIDNTHPVIGDTLTAITEPADAKVTYQWYNSDGIIEGATDKSYTPTEDDLLKHVSVYVTGTGEYSGKASARTTSPVQGVYVTSVSLDIPRPVYGDTITAVTNVADGDLKYQWYNSDGIIKGATDKSYTPTKNDILKHLRVYVKGQGRYSGTATVRTTAPVQKIQVLGVTLDNPRPVYGDTLTAVVNPADADVTYQWYNSDGIIKGATDKTYKPTQNDIDKHIRVYVKGQGAYGGTVTVRTTNTVKETATTPLKSVTLDIPRPTYGDTLTAVVTPADATATYQWYNSDGIIKGATGKTYTPTANDVNKQIRVYVKGTGSYEGTVTVRTTAPVQRAVITGVSLDIPRPTYGDTITAVTVPEDADATYQWYNSDGKIEGATGKSYTPTQADIMKHLRVYVKGANGYTGTVTVRTTAPVQRQ